MKSNDIINEGPLDFAKKVGGGISGAVSGTGFASGYGAAKSEIQATQVHNMTADRMFQDWAKVTAGLKAAGQPVKPEDLQAWITKRFGGVRTTMPADLGNNSVLKFIRAEVGAYNAGLPAPAPAPAPEMDVATWIDFFKKLKPADKRRLRRALGI